VLPVIGVGVLARVDRLSDGRFNIVLRGVQRARIEQEHASEQPYRLVRRARSARVRVPPRDRWPAI